MTTTPIPDFDPPRLSEVRLLLDDLKRLRSERETLAREKAELVEKVRRLEAAAAKEEAAQLQLIDQRDGAEDALSRAYMLVTDRPAEWSNVFGYADALDDIELALHDARALSPEPIGAENG